MSNKKEDKTMQPAVKRALVPKLRFPEFRDAREWEEKRLGDVCDVTRGGSPRPIIDFITTAENGLPWLRIGDIDPAGKYITTTSEKIKSEGLSKTTMIQPNEFILSNSMSFGRPYISKIAVCIHDGWLALRKLSKNLTPDFLYYLISSEQLQKTFEQTAAGTGVRNLKSESVKRILLLLPSLEEQQKIADCLSSIDDLITAQTQKLDTLKAHKKGMMQQLFPAEGETLPKLRFPEFREAGEWEKKNLIDVADKTVKWSFIGGPFGSNLKSSDYVDDGIRIIQLQNIGDAEFIDDYRIFTSEEKADELLSNNIYPRDIILSKMGDPVGRACLIPDTNNRYVMCSDGIRLVVDESLNSKYFIYLLINSMQFRSIVEKTATGSTRKRIGLDELKNLPMLLPNRNEQQKIANCLASLDDLITAQTQKLDTLKAHKKGLMQQLFSALDEGPE